MDLAKTAEFAADLGNVERVEVLPFHQMGRYKWERLGLDYTLRDVEPPTTEAAELASEMFRKGICSPRPVWPRTVMFCRLAGDVGAAGVSSGTGPGAV